METQLSVGTWFRAMGFIQPNQSLGPTIYGVGEPAEETAVED